jgi:hypothetical protein
MSYSPLDHREQMYHQNPSGYNNSQSDIEFQSLAPSFVSGKSDWVRHNEAVQNNASSDYQHLVQPTYPEPTGTLWQPGFWRQLPILGVLSLLGVLTSNQCLPCIHLWAQTHQIIRHHSRPRDIDPEQWTAFRSLGKWNCTVRLLSCRFSGS